MQMTNVASWDTPDGHGGNGTVCDLVELLPALCLGFKSSRSLSSGFEVTIFILDFCLQA